MPPLQGGSCGFDSYRLYGGLVYWIEYVATNDKRQVRFLYPLGMIKLRDRLLPYEGSNIRSIRVSSTVTVAERLCTGLWSRVMRVRIPSVTSPKGELNLILSRRNGQSAAHMRDWCNGSISAFQAFDMGSIPIFRSLPAW